VIRRLSMGELPGMGQRRATFLCNICFENCDEADRFRATETATGPPCPHHFCKPW
jgi:hypothetical protein